MRIDSTNQESSLPLYYAEVSDSQHLSLDEFLLFQAIRHIFCISPITVCSSLHPLPECTQYNLQGSEVSNFLVLRGAWTTGINDTVCGTE